MQAPVQAAFALFCLACVVCGRRVQHDFGGLQGEFAGGHRQVEVIDALFRAQRLRGANLSIMQEGQTNVFRPLAKLLLALNLDAAFNPMPPAPGILPHAVPLHAASASSRSATISAGPPLHAGTHSKELYKRLRELPLAKLWREKVPRYNIMTQRRREEQAALVRAIGVNYASANSTRMKERVREWLVELLEDPSPKVRRYAIDALQKVGGGKLVERQLASLLDKTEIEKERQQITSVLGKIAKSSKALEVAVQKATEMQSEEEQTLRAKLARKAEPSAISLNTGLPRLIGLSIHLKCRRGLEEFLLNELEDVIVSGRFRVLEQREGCIVIQPAGTFMLKDLYRLRCFDSLSFVLWEAEQVNGLSPDQVARAIASKKCEKIMRAFTSGSLRYRLDIPRETIDELSQENRYKPAEARAQVEKRIVQDAFSLNREILYDRQSVWTVEVQTAPIADGTGVSMSVELVPRFPIDRRFGYSSTSYSSYPPLAAAMVRMAGKLPPNPTIFDPFCGTGVELIEAALAHANRNFSEQMLLLGSDANPSAVIYAQKNIREARRRGALTRKVKHVVNATDCMDAVTIIPDLMPLTVDLIITNPPNRKRQSIQDLFRLSTQFLKEDGLLVFINEQRVKLPPDLRKMLSPVSNYTVDLGRSGEASIEVWRREGHGGLIETMRNMKISKRARARLR